MSNNLWENIKSLKTLGFKMLPNFNREYFLYKKSEFQAQYQFSIDIKDEESSIEDIYVYGWAIEIKWKDHKNEHWYNHWNHIIYNSKESAIDAINQLTQTSTMLNKYEMRVLPLYNFKNNGFRNHIITKILENK